jgi:hypothetical protein
MEDTSIVLINLAQVKCNSLTFTSESGLNKTELETLGLKISGVLPVSYYYQYEHNNITHLMRLRLIPNRTEQKVAVSFIYTTAEAANIPKAIIDRNPKALEYFVTLCESDKILLFKCISVFMHKRDDKDSFFMLPLRLPEQPSSGSYDEIRGIRIVKLKDNKIVVENSFDLIEESTITQTVKFAYEAKFALDLPQTILQESTKLKS